MTLINLLPTTTLGLLSPWYKLYGQHLDLSSLKNFGCACYPFLKPYNKHKLNHRTTECIFLGYSTVSKGYLCLDLLTNKLYTCRHVLFNETRFPFSFATSFVSAPNPPNPDAWLSNLLYLHSSNQPSILGPYSRHTPPSNSQSPSFPLPQTVTSTIPTPSALVTSPTLSTPVANPTPSTPLNNSTSISYSTSPSLFDPTSTPPKPSPPLLPISVHSSQPNTTSSVLAPVNTHPMITRSKNGISKPKICYKAVDDYTYTEPHHTRLPLSFLNGLRPWMRSFRLYKGRKLGLLFLQYLVSIW